MTSPKIRSLVRYAFDLHNAPRGPVVQRLAIPHTFEHGLAGPQAAIAIAEAFIRIILGSVLFALWGTFVWWSWSAIANIFVRVVVASVLAVAFVPLMLALMIVISLGARAIARGARHAGDFEK